VPEAPVDAAARAIADAVEAAEGRLAPKKRAVIEAAVLSFAEAGYAATSTRAIAERAGVAEATIFRHFPTKKALLLRLVRPVVDRLLLPAIEGEARVLAAAAGDDLPAFMRAIMLSRLAFADAHAPLIRILLQELPVNPDLQDILGHDIFAAIVGIADRIVTPRMAAGQLRSVPVERLLRWLFSLLIGYYVTRTMMAPGDWDDEAEVAAMVDTVTRGLRP
jgi:AcrR family transcriptional regulator